MKTGIVYIAFGERARQEVKRSIESLRTVACNLPVLVVGDSGQEPTERQTGAGYFKEWTGVSPFFEAGRHNFKFFAGHIKPHLYNLSPFDRTLYLDADTEVLQPVQPGFDLLENWHILIAKHPRQNLNQLYNKPRAGWEHNIAERNATIQEWDGNGDVPYWNSGVIFWRKCPEVEKVFSSWAQQWARYAQWDEQQALMRAVYNNPLRVCVLPETWNHPHRHQAKIIFHDYGRGKARSNPK